MTGFPTDFPRGFQQGAEGGLVWFQIPGSTVVPLNALAKETDATLFMVILTALTVLLHRWSGDTDFTVGSPIANRPRKEREGLIGFFVNTLPLRVRMEDDPTFHDLLLQVRGVTRESYSHAELPFEQLGEKRNRDRRLNQSPFFQIMLSMQSSPVNQTVLDGLAVEALPVSTGASRLDVTVSMRETPEGIAGNLEFASALFRPDTAQRFTEHLRNLLAAASLRPDTRISQLEILSHGERHRILVEWNRTSVDYDRTACLHQLFESQAKATPDAIALRHRNAAWTYLHLLEVSGQIALLLQSRGVGPDSLVAVCLDRTPLLIAALLGVLRSGGAYVALDPAYPVSRLRFILEDTAAPVVLTSAQLAADMGEAIPAGAEIVRLDAIELHGAAEPLPEIRLSPSNLAYVLYTSGSTGRPKGVAIEHRSPVALIAWARSIWPLEELRGVLAGTSTCFDLSVFEIFLPLAEGGTVILASNVLELPSIECRDQVTLINTVPSAIDTLLRQDGIPASVRVVNLAGEPLSTELADRIYGVPTVRKVYDLYGPSEDTTYSTFILRKPGDPASIGRPIANTRLYILDKALQPVPVGSTGEICLAGDGLARGYLGRKDLTEERFVPGPFPGAGRLYRTGDLARFRPDGNVEFLGRVDQQIKIRGFRIEPGEIETVLGEFPGTGRCLVIVREAAGERRLVAYVTHPTGETAAPALQSHLRARLPEYMIPSAIVVLEALPLTPNGKIDRAALPAPEFRHAPEPQHELISPRNLTESRLATVFTEVLGVSPIGVTDNFFDLGGDSLAAMTFLAKVKQLFGERPSMSMLFQAPTIEQFAVALEQHNRFIPQIIPVQPRGSLPPFFCIGAGPLFRPLSSRLGAGRPFLSLMPSLLPELKRLSAPYQLDRIAAYLISSVLDYQKEGPYYLGGWSDAGVVAYETARQLVSMGHEVAVLFLFDAENPSFGQDRPIESRLASRVKKIKFHAEELSRLKVDDVPAYFAEKVKELQRKISAWRLQHKNVVHPDGGSGENADEIVQLAVQHYRPPPYAGRLVYFQAAERPAGDAWDMSLGWDHLVTEFEAYEVPGDHRSMFLEPNVELLANYMRDKFRVSDQRKHATNPTGR